MNIQIAKKFEKKKKESDELEFNIQIDLLTKGKKEVNSNLYLYT